MRTTFAVTLWGCSSSRGEELSNFSATMQKEKTCDESDEVIFNRFPLHSSSSGFSIQTLYVHVPLVVGVDHCGGIWDLV